MGKGMRVGRNVLGFGTTLMVGGIALVLAPVILLSAIMDEEYENMLLDSDM